MAGAAVGQLRTASATAMPPFSGIIVTFRCFGRSAGRFVVRRSASASKAWRRGSRPAEGSSQPGMPRGSGASRPTSRAWTRLSSRPRTRRPPAACSAVRQIPCGSQEWPARERPADPGAPGGRSGTGAGRPAPDPAARRRLRDRRRLRRRRRRAHRRPRRCTRRRGDGSADETGERHGGHAAAPGVRRRASRTSGPGAHHLSGRGTAVGGVARGQRGSCSRTLRPRSWFARSGWPPAEAPCWIRR